MRFVLQMAWRDSKASRRRLLLYSLCLVFGIGALVALDSFSLSLARSIAQESKSLLGADLVLSSRLPLPAPVRAAVAASGAETAEQIRFSSMARLRGATRLVQVRAQAGTFPFYGQIDATPRDAVARLRAAERTGEPVAIVEQSLLTAYGAKPGDAIRLGTENFRIVGALRQISGESFAIIQLAPRVLVPAAALARAGLGADGPLVRRQLALKLPSGVDADALARSWRDRFAADRLEIETVAGRRRQLGRSLTNVDGFLSLVGFVALLLGAVGVASAVHAHVQSKVPTVALLRCIGVTSRQAFAIYLAQGAALGAVGAIGGGVVGIATQALLPRVVASLLPVPVTFALSFAGVARGMAVGWAVCLLVALIPLLGVGRVSPLAALRAHGSEGSASRLTWPRVLLALVQVAAIAAFAYAQTRNARLGAGFALAVVLGFALFVGAARAASALAARWAPARAPYALRQGLANLHRPQNRTTLLLVALGLATFLSFTLLLTRAAFSRELRSVGMGDRPNLMFYDVQDDQVRPLEAFLRSRHLGAMQDASVIAMKIEALRGRPVDEWLKDAEGPPSLRYGGRSVRAGTEDAVPAWTLRYEYRSTARDHLAPTERVVAGKFVGRMPPATDPAKALVPISVEEGLARDMHLRIGDHIDWNVQGLIVHTEVGSIRSVDWRRLSPNFFVVFPLGVLDDAPKFWVVAVRAPSADVSGAVQAEAVRRFPSVTVIDLQAILQTVDGILSKVGFVVGFMALFTAATAVVVLACSVLSGRQQRRREAVLLRILGASARQLWAIQASEYALLGALGAVIGCLLGWGASASLDRWVFDFPAAAPAGDFAAAIAVVMAVTLVTGWAADRDLARVPPLEALRAE